MYLQADSVRAKQFFPDDHTVRHAHERLLLLILFLFSLSLLSALDVARVEVA
jgi:hypothetical protein